MYGMISTVGMPAGLKRMAAAATILLGVAGGAANAEVFVQNPIGTTPDGLASNFAYLEGMFKDAGLEGLEVVHARGGGDAVRTLAAAGRNEGAYALVSLAAAVRAITTGVPVKIINVETKSLAHVSLVVRADSDIQSIEDLAGRSVAIGSPLSLSDIFVRAAVESREADIPIEYVSMGGNQATLVALENGSVDAAVLLEPRVSASAAANQFRPVFSGEELPPVAIAVGISTNDFIENNPEYLRTLLAVRQEATRIMIEDPDRVAAVMAPHFNVDAELFAEVIRDLAAKDLFTVTGARDLEALEAMMRMEAEAGGFDEEVDWDELFDDRFIPDPAD